MLNLNRELAKGSLKHTAAVIRAEIVFNTYRHPI
jgi:hypothetical protein